MGLDCSHDAFSGAYAAFNRLRQCVCAAFGPDASFPPHWEYGPGGELKKIDGQVIYRNNYDEKYFYLPDDVDETNNPGIYEFLGHSDSDGEISPDMCGKVADELEALLPRIKEMDWKATGHIAARGGYIETLKLFISGCRKAAKNNEPLQFY